MKYNLLGNSELEVSEISLGCMSLKPDAIESEMVLHEAFDLGVNFFDTADLYDKGANEILVGKALKEKRKDIIIATKVGNQWRTDSSGWDWNPSKAYILNCVDQSLKRLQTDYIDLYQLHGGTIEDPVDEIIEAFEMLIEQGKIRYYGISSIRPNVIKEYVAKSNIVSVMTQYSLLDRRAEESTLNLLMRNHIGVLARGSLARGLLVDKPAKAYLDHSIEAVLNASKSVESISLKNKSKAQSAIQFALKHPAISTVAIGARTVNQLLDAIEMHKLEPLSDEELKTLKSSCELLKYTSHK